MGEHAKLSASGSHIWLNCTPSVRMSEGIPDRQTAFTEEGTTAHKLAELLIDSLIIGSVKPTSFTRALERIGKSEYYSEEMYGYVKSYVNWVDGVYSGVQARSEDYELLTEQRLDFSAWVPGGFGTGDVVIITDGTLTVIVCSIVNLGYYTFNILIMCMNLFRSRFASSHVIHDRSAYENKNSRSCDDTYDARITAE